MTAVLALALLSAPPQRYAFEEMHMGVKATLTFYAANEAQARRAATAAFARVGELDGILSDYRVDSELNQLLKTPVGEPKRVSRDLYRVLQASLRMAALSDGVFDVTLGPVVRVWREARRVQKLPPPGAIEAARGRVDWRAISLDPEAQSVTLLKPGLAIDFGGIAKGYAVDEAVRVLAENGVASAMAEAGGDIAVTAPPPGKPGWTITVLNLPDVLILRDAAVSTSGDASQFVEIDGIRYSHIVDPRTGLGLTNRRQATIIARRGFDTDPLATTVCILGPEAAPLLTRFRARAIIRNADGSTLRL